MWEGDSPLLWTISTAWHCRGDAPTAGAHAVSPAVTFAVDRVIHNRMDHATGTVADANGGNDVHVDKNEVL